MSRVIGVVLLLAVLGFACAPAEEPVAVGEATTGPTSAPETPASAQPTSPATSSSEPAVQEPSAGGEPGTTAPQPTSAPAPGSVSLDALTLGLEEVASGFTQPVFLTTPAGDDRLFVVDQPGVVWVLEGGEWSRFLDLRRDVRFAGEQGLLGMAFHPDYEDNGRFFVNYVDGGGDTRVVEFTVDPDDPMKADPATAREIIGFRQPAANHNGGMLAFGPDGYLWIGMGDGGGRDDQFGHGQRPDTALGTLVRLDVDAGQPFAIPPDNPFGVVWAFGLRNPWRFAFDGGQVFVADVGQGRWEEISVVPVTTPGLNFGWPIQEGTSCFAESPCSTDGLVQPAHEYSHQDGCSITGGFVYRGSEIPALDGAYFFGDYCTGFVRTLAPDGTVHDWTDDVGRVRELTSFGLDAAGEMYVVSGTGSVYKVVSG